MGNEASWPAVALCVLIAGCQGSSASDHAAALQQMNEQCVQTMVTSTCVVMRGQDVSLIPARATTVFVAGLGEVDAALYRQLRQQGEGMCGHLVSVCRQDWDGTACRTARHLYGRGSTEALASARHQSPLLAAVSGQVSAPDSCRPA